MEDLFEDSLEDSLEDKITVVIPNYNGRGEIAGCIESLLREIGEAALIVVDDGSTDGSASFLRERFPGIRLIAYEENRGFAHAVNQGIRAARTPYVFLFNNDARLLPGALHALLRTMEEGGAGIFSVGAKMLSRAKPHLIDNCGDLYCVLGWAFTPGRDGDAHWYARRAAVTSACAGAALYRRELLLQLGLFDEAHFCYLEDVDLGIRARLSGYCNLYEPRALALHTGSATSGSRHNDFKVRLSAGNQIYLAYKNFPGFVLLALSPWLLLGNWIKFVYFLRAGLGLSYLKGLGEGLTKIRKGKDRRIRPQNARAWASLGKLLLEMHLNLIRRVAG